ncbi:MAG TPA: hypothetical protein DCW68_00760 [Rhodospirillaceae bacterium]|nr:MAG: hypothetical protein A2018_00850 [Alphaproteobacteria bacterium GWF2_58_20]HAU28630.1 hypothetical protein [Rhodospirillaceae bacterium]
MKKRILTTFLLLVIASLGQAMFHKTRAITPSMAAETTGTPQDFPKDNLDMIPSIPVADNQLVVYYFHGRVRCPTCKMMEALTRETLETHFTEEYTRERIVMQTVNLDVPENRHYINDYQLTSGGVVLAGGKNNMPDTFKILPNVWRLAHDREAFIQYVTDEITSFK